VSQRLYYVAGLPATARYPAVPYGYSTRAEDAYAALDRARARGIKWAEVWTRKLPVRALRANQWLDPFDDRKAGFR
jgi:hypothetical protein